MYHPFNSGLVPPSLFPNLMLYFSAGPLSYSNFCEKSPSQNGQRSWRETLILGLHQFLAPTCFHQTCTPTVHSAESLCLFLYAVWMVKLALISCILITPSYLQRLWSDISLLETTHSKMSSVPEFWTSRRGKAEGMVISHVEWFHEFAKGHRGIMC